MLERISLVRHLGRLEGWDAQAAARDEARFRKLTVVYGRNGTGKSTLARALAAAGAGDGPALVRDQALDAVHAPHLTLEMSGGTVRFDGKAWHGPRPEIAVFDREFVERNVYIGRHVGKDQRKELLRLALGSADVEMARALDGLARRTRQLQTDRKPHEEALDAAARACGLTRAQLTALEPADDVAGELARAEAAQRDAIAGATLLRLPRPEPLPPPPDLQLPALEALLATEARALGEAAAAEVEAHLQRRLGGNGHAWVREGLRHADGKTCPFCAQPLKAGSLVEQFRVHFDRAYDRLVDDVARARARVAELDAWWEAIVRAGQANVRACAAWEITAPSFESAARQKQVQLLGRAIAAVLDDKQRDANRAVKLDRDTIAGVHGELAAAVATYNAELAKLTTAIDARLRATSKVPPGEASRRIEHIKARMQRGTKEVAGHIAALAELAGKADELRAAKEDAAARLDAHAAATLDAFAAKMNRTLRELGADFTVALGHERHGGTVGARLGLTLERGTLTVATSRDEKQLEHVLSEGDRSVLGLAVFLLALEQRPDVTEQVVVFDDPVTSQDADRARRTAESIVAIARRAAQVIVMAHQAPFLKQVVAAWGTADDLRELELHKEHRALEPWSASTHVDPAPAPVAAPSRPKKTKR